MAIYKTRGRFGNFEDEDYAAFLYWLNTVYKILNAWLFSEKLLDKAYDTIQSKF